MRNSQIRFQKKKIIVWCFQRPNEKNRLKELRAKFWNFHNEQIKKPVQ